MVIDKFYEFFLIADIMFLFRHDFAAIMSDYFIDNMLTLHIQYSVKHLYCYTVGCFHMLYSHVCMMSACSDITLF